MWLWSKHNSHLDNFYFVGQLTSPVSEYFLSLKLFGLEVVPSKDRFCHTFPIFEMRFYYKTRVVIRTAFHNWTMWCFSFTNINCYTTDNYEQCQFLVIQKAQPLFWAPYKITTSKTPGNMWVCNTLSEGIFLFLFVMN